MSDYHNSMRTRSDNREELLGHVYILFFYFDSSNIILYLVKNVDLINKQNINWNFRPEALDYHKSFRYIKLMAFAPILLYYTSRVLYE